MEMKIFSHIRRYGLGALTAAVLALGFTTPAAALTAAQEFTVVLSRINSDGTVTSVSSTSATTDANGKLVFTLSDLPTSVDTNFVLLQVKDASGTVVRQGIAPAPAEGSTNLVGINPLSDIQARALTASMQANNSDDPLGVAFGLVFVRSPNLQASDISILAQMMGTAIMGSDGMEAFLLSNGVSAAELATFKKKLVSNSASGSKDMSDYIAFFKSAVDSGSDDDMAKAGGIMGDIFIDAGAAAGVDPTLLLTSFNAAGDAQGLDTLMMSLSSGFGTSVEQAVTGFFTRIAAVKLKREYSDALAALGGSQSLIDRFNTGVQAFVTTQQQIDVQNQDFFMDPEQFTEQQRQARQQTIDDAFQAAFDTFKSDIQVTNTERDAMRATIATALTIDVNTLPLDVGREYDFSGTQVNWSIPQTVAVLWVANNLIAGGDMSYTRDNTPIPSSMQGWLSQRTDFVGQGMPASFAALMEISEDVMIIENTRWAIYQNGQPTPAQEEQARLSYLNLVQSLISNISGTTNGSTAVNAAEREAMVKLMQEPSLF
ncbi:MAG: hypothetical protein BMS9Abin06_0033 [Gammaproteobacteria bacterium]|nr:MAG: hypothetical protein BMS9Abin06_0033 [Gammaproteobacteria bacterium]